MSGSISPLSGAEDQLAAARALIQQQGAPMTAENLNRASLHTATANGVGPLLFDQALERAMGNPSPRQARQATTQAPPVQPPIAPTEFTGPPGAPAAPGVATVSNPPAVPGAVPPLVLILLLLVLCQHLL